MTEEEVREQFRKMTDRVGIAHAAVEMGVSVISAANFLLGWRSSRGRRIPVTVPKTMAGRMGVSRTWDYSRMGWTYFTTPDMNRQRWPAQPHVGGAARWRIDVRATIAHLRSLADQAGKTLEEVLREEG